MAYPYDAGDLAAISRLGTFYNGNAYNASTNAGGFDNDGHRVNFVPCLQDVARVASAVASAASSASTSASNAATSETNASLSAAKLQGTSVTTNTPALGSKSFVTQSGKFFANADLKIYSAATPGIYMIGTATSYSGTALTVNVDSIGTASSASDWVIIVTGRTGATGVTGATGATGAAGPTGKAAGISLTWNTNTASSDPGTGQVKANNATLASATALYISETDADSNVLSALLATWDDGSSTNKSRVHLYNPLAPANFWDFYITGTLTDNGTWDSFNITHIASGGSFTNGVGLYAIDTPVGDKGDTGATGGTGATGATGPVIATKFTFSTTTTDSDPGGPGNVRFNNATIASVTFLYFDNTDISSTTVTTWLDSFGTSTNTANRGEVNLVDVSTPSNDIKFTVTGAVVDGTGYRKVPVTYVQGTLPSNAATLAVTFARTGNKGADGAGSGDVVGPSSAVDSNIAVFDTTTGKLIKDGGATVASLQPKDATLTALAGISSAANQIILITGSDTFSNISFTTGAQAAAALVGAADKVAYYSGAATAALMDFSSLARTLVANTTASGMRSTLGSVIGTDVQAWAAKLDAVVALTWAADKGVYFTSASAVATYDLSSFARTFLDDADAAAVRTTISAQQQDGTLDALAGVTVAANKLIYATGADAFATTDLSAFARTFIDDADASAVRTTLGIPTTTLATVDGAETLTAKTLTAPKFASGGFIADANGNEQIIFTTTASAVNEMTLVNAATGGNPQLKATGGDSNVGLELAGKGSKGVYARNAFAEEVSVLTDGATPALDASLGNIFTLSAAGNRTIAVPSNARTGQKIIIRHLASGGARTLALNTGAGGFRFGSDITALTATASGKTDYIGCVYNAADSFWDVVAVTKGF